MQFIGSFKIHGRIKKEELNVSESKKEINRKKFLAKELKCIKTKCKCP